MEKLHDDFKSIRKHLAALEIEASEIAPDFQAAQNHATIAAEAIGRVMVAIEERISNARNIAQGSLSAGRLAGDAAQVAAKVTHIIRE